MYICHIRSSQIYWCCRSLFSSRIFSSFLGICQMKKTAKCSLKKLNYFQNRKCDQKKWFIFSVHKNWNADKATILLLLLFYGSVALLLHFTSSEQARKCKFRTSLHYSIYNIVHTIHCLLFRCCFRNRFAMGLSICTHLCTRFHLVRKFVKAQYMWHPWTKRNIFCFRQNCWNAVLLLANGKKWWNF